MTEMRFTSTRDAKLTAAFGEALTQGLAPDGGLYVPVEWPRFSAGTWGPWESPADTGARDTGAAVAASFHGRPGIQVAVLFPKGLVSPTQERRLTCWGGNVRSFSVPGSESLARLFARPTSRTEIEADLDSRRDALREDPT